MVKVNILIAEPCEIIRYGLHIILSDKSRVLSIYDVSKEEDLSPSITSFQPDVIIINQSLIKDISLLKARYFFVLALEPELATLKKMYDYGALGYFSLNVSAEVLRTMLDIPETSFFIEPALGPWIIDAAIRTLDRSSNRRYITIRRKCCNYHKLR